ncbi:CPBP family intramembrane glutamic endopeptidase [Furfurilactobacillus rossiae]|uniref:CAAX prenyl protease 2/Lysostaphin resistance protein A-like domain-containing protein n=1 Tax=Furfurilactobacillus rossiae DSM 15814 TaxID=1114972 RepID=A0A0R1R9N4_9LACO|nr:CPBP family intramembrane glutamic endopeptidase [Furfurilactobacillus rossiae]KRL53759.1 hypothetical protein FD35_GL000865 [Furfurilactobacillus rossiae DSM 15814]MCF6164607.1 CPBP family intramembrane metalloprotease [Furfurilactobacillus rossiae]QLE62177.1 hypothetical protein LROSRS0_2132 [Furfurilactobacillus rossiae]QLE64893.1 hypothetical protein LROSL1_2092 [Furfurilactobacillus rossiae]
MSQNKWFKVLVPWVVVIIVALLFGWIQRSTGSTISFIVIFEVVMFTSVWLLNHFWLHVPIFLRPTERSWRLLPINWTSLVVLLLAIAVVFGGKGNFWLSCVVLVFVGITEEFAFRGVILPLASKLGSVQNQLWVGILVSSALFGVAHGVNLLHQALLITGFQMLSAFSIGILLSALYLRTGSLVFPILLHGLNDFLSSYGSGGLQSPQVSLTGVGLALVYLLTGLFLLRKSKRNTIQQPIKA